MDRAFLNIHLLGIVKLDAGATIEDEFTEYPVSQPTLT